MANIQMAENREIQVQLSAAFPRDQVSWRAQSVTQDGTKALALAYIDARDVMGRLDQVLGPDNWMDSYIDTGKRTYCTLSLRVGHPDLNFGWVSKTDAAGDSDIEAAKGAVSDAFKRAAVKWGIGRYLYDMPTPWVPCKIWMKGEKKMFDSFTVDPWTLVKEPPPVNDPAAPKRRLYTAIQKELMDAKGSDDLAFTWESRTDDLAIIKDYSQEGYDKLLEEKERLEKRFKELGK